MVKERAFSFLPSALRKKRDIAGARSISGGIPCGRGAITIAAGTQTGGFDYYGIPYKNLLGWVKKVDSMVFMNNSSFPDTAD
jgi:hypothetical protein